MKAILKKGKGPGIHLEDIPIPRVDDSEVLVQVKACGICGSDIHVYQWSSGYEWMEQYMPIVIGHEFSGIVVNTGAGVDYPKTGSRVVCRPVVPCGHCHYCRDGHPAMCSTAAARAIGLRRNGGFAEYVAVPAANCIELPDALTFEEGALLEPLAVAANAAYDGNLLMGDTVVVIGPGPIGLLTMMCAKAMGAGTAIVLGAAGDGNRLAMARRLGADHALVTDGDVLKRVLELTGGHGADVVFEATGVPETINLGLDMLQKAGTLVAAGIHSAPAALNTTPLVRGAKKITGTYGGPVTWERLIRWLSSGGDIAAKMPGVVTHRFRFDDAEEAFTRCVSKEAVKALFIN